MAQKRNEYKFIQQWYCPQTNKLQLVDVRDPFCSHCRRKHKLGHYVPNADQEYYRIQDCWYLPSFFREERQ